MEFAGICIFSIISGLYQQLIKVPSVHDVIQLKAQDITMYLQRVDQANSDDSMDSTIYDSTIDFIKKSYLYGVVQSLRYDNEFYSQMSPSLKTKLVFVLLRQYYQKFFYFFNDVEHQNFADKVFIRKVLGQLDCQIFIEGTTIMEAGKPFNHLYFNYKGFVTMTDSQ